MSRRDRPDELLALAQRDYEAALILARAENPQKDAAGFHLQQSVEKTLKAWLAFRGVEYPRTHDLNVLLGVLEDQGEEITAFWGLLELNPFAVQFRYELAGEDFANFEELAGLAGHLLKDVKSVLETA